MSAEKDESDVAASTGPGSEKTGLPSMSVSLGQQDAEGAVDGIGRHLQLERAAAPGAEIGVCAAEDAGPHLHEIGAHPGFHLATVWRIERLQNSAAHCDLPVDGHVRRDAHRRVDEAV